MTRALPVALLLVLALASQVSLAYEFKPTPITVGLDTVRWRLIGTNIYTDGTHVTVSAHVYYEIVSAPTYYAFIPLYAVEFPNARVGAGSFKGYPWTVVSNDTHTLFVIDKVVRPVFWLTITSVRGLLLDFPVDWAAAGGSLRVGVMAAGWRNGTGIVLVYNTTDGSQLWYRFTVPSNTSITCHRPLLDGFVAYMEEGILVARIVNGTLVLRWAPVPEGRLDCGFLFTRNGIYVMDYSEIADTVVVSTTPVPLPAGDYRVVPFLTLTSDNMTWYHVVPPPAILPASIAVAEYMFDRPVNPALHVIGDMHPARVTVANTSWVSVPLYTVPLETVNVTAALVELPVVDAPVMATELANVYTPMAYMDNVSYVGVVNGTVFLDYYVQDTGQSVDVYVAARDGVYRFRLPAGSDVVIDVLLWGRTAIWYRPGSTTGWYLIYCFDLPSSCWRLETDIRGVGGFIGEPITGYPLVLVNNVFSVLFPNGTLASYNYTYSCPQSGQFFEPWLVPYWDGLIGFVVGVLVEYREGVAVPAHIIGPFVLVGGSIAVTYSSGRTVWYDNSVAIYTDYDSVVDNDTVLCLSRDLGGSCFDASIGVEYTVPTCSVWKTPVRLQAERVVPERVDGTVYPVRGGIAVPWFGYAPVVPGWYGLALYTESFNVSVVDGFVVFRANLTTKATIPLGFAPGTVYRIVVDNTTLCEGFGACEALRDPVSGLIVVDPVTVEIWLAPVAAVAASEPAPGGMLGGRGLALPVPTVLAPLAGVLAVAIYTFSRKRQQ